MLKQKLRFGLLLFVVWGGGGKGLPFVCKINIFVVVNDSSFFQKFIVFFAKLRSNVFVRGDGFDKCFRKQLQKIRFGMLFCVRELFFFEQKLFCCRKRFRFCSGIGRILQMFFF